MLPVGSLCKLREFIEIKCWPSRFFFLWWIWRTQQHSGEEEGELFSGSCALTKILHSKYQVHVQSWYLHDSNGTSVRNFM